MQVDAIEKRTREARAILLDFALGATTNDGRMAEIRARTGIHRRDEREARGIRDDGRRTRDHDASVFQWLAQRLEGVTWEFEQLVEKEHAMVRQTHLARPRRAPTADESRGRDGVVRRAKGTSNHQRR